MQLKLGREFNGGFFILDEALQSIHMRFPEGLSLKASAALKIIFSVYPQMFFLKKKIKKKKDKRNYKETQRKRSSPHFGGQKTDQNEASLANADSGTKQNIPLQTMSQRSLFQ